MGLLTPLLATDERRTDARRLDASAAATTPTWWPNSLHWPELDALDYATRAQAMQVPTIARARNLLAGTVAELPLGRFDRDGHALDPSPFLDQPDRSTPRAVLLAWTLDDLLFHGFAYWRVVELYREDGRPARVERVHPERVDNVVDNDGWTITHRTVDGRRVPDRGVGRLLVFQALDEGLLARAGRTVLTALALERAARRYADEPLPASVLKNTGADLPATKVTELLSRWRQARRDGSVGYLNASIDLERVGWSAGELQLVEARQHLAVELARVVGVPAWFVGADTGSSMTYSNVTAERRTLIDYSLRPYLAAIEQRLTMPDVVPSPVQVRFDLDGFLRGDPRERAEVLAILLDRGVITVDEARAREDLATDDRTGTP